MSRGEPVRSEDWVRRTGSDVEWVRWEGVRSPVSAATYTCRSNPWTLGRHSRCSLQGLFRGVLIQVSGLLVDFFCCNYSGEHDDVEHISPQTNYGP
ncbi:hypothetical protein VNO77_19410 [Canavalia gladiata]|uniref:Uncharacterized protein n=1 Tax=Canavalia gladiata TaxID=3824 RepID=A0AAN9QKG1_CANGL